MPEPIKQKQMQNYVAPETGLNSFQMVDVDGEQVMVLNTRKNTPEDDAVANIDFYGLGNREQTIVRLSRMSEEQIKAERQKARHVLDMLYKARVMAINNAAQNALEKNSQVE